MLGEVGVSPPPNEVLDPPLHPSIRFYVDSIQCTCKGILYPLQNKHVAIDSFLMNAIIARKDVSTEG